ncbi:hypothetical protein CC1G_11354 [Coprinopsis cinerea okayama7|uniref:Uncharacterized protein n=1 Tax=Coprinopsis cinerea (strain Okayama-7 / 130 / ATCC MYA-4618 / FGSC 9003) TaxID=240176 RepID=A8P8V5_COPC7|nr:hypothetical protein CC1G_11354 [Coprinopsis cinerea okayama7\|eukprot:XP_001839643.1 hypothetical protein CC1G_11354 [Coprinopsis cinerea okayama7\
MTGLFYAVFQALHWANQSSTGIPNLQYYTAGNIFNTLYYTFTALSPQMIIFRVTAARSHTCYEDLDTSINPESEPLGELAFYKGPAGRLSLDSAQDNEEGFGDEHENGDLIVEESRHTSDECAERWPRERFLKEKLTV